MKTDLTGKSVLLYSGGLDSYIAAALFRPDVLLHVDTGTNYGDAENKALAVPKGMEDRLVTIPFRDLAQWERSEDLILPGRNAHLVLAGAHYGDSIMLGATAGDRTKDKDENFAELMTSLLQYMYSDQWWIPGGRDVRVVLPIKSKTKRQLVHDYKEAGHSIDALVNDTFSCYYPEDGLACTECKPCVRKWVALWAEHINPGFDSLNYAKRVRITMDNEPSRGEQEKRDFDEAIAIAEGAQA